MATLRVAAKPEVARMKVAQVSKPGGDFEIVERGVPEPGPRQVRIKVQACGVCHSDVLTKEGLFAEIQYPRVPGHEVIGVIEWVPVQDGKPQKSLRKRLKGQAKVHIEDQERRDFSLHLTE